ncbi:winged helix-turn-helix domain-containing protein [Maridesulfovibrio zosterae]|uniref:winged helix-turn-helix domain-containing protein n=1 Tax=Maridesulfovibrio zosterae TaxID=82171 RepID=UPI0003F963FA|nr:winged helix-turn-helix domain-containing protein [Maridesulfovibrio zosterae]
MHVPKFYELMTPVLRAIESLGGEAQLAQVADEVIKILCPSENTHCCLMKPKGDHSTTINYLVHHACKYLCCYGVVEKKDDQFLCLTDKYETGMTVDYSDILQEAQSRLVSKALG